jgi:hypothetical protein
VRSGPQVLYQLQLQRKFKSCTDKERKMKIPQNRTMSEKDRGTKGFTVVEILAFIAVLILLAGLIIPFLDVPGTTLLNTCNIQLNAMASSSQACASDLASALATNSEPNCTNCDIYNTKAAQFDAGACKQFGPLGTYPCP